MTACPLDLWRPDQLRFLINVASSAAEEVKG